MLVKCEQLLEGGHQHIIEASDAAKHEEQQKSDWPYQIDTLTRQSLGMILLRDGAPHFAMLYSKRRIGLIGGLDESGASAYNITNRKDGVLLNGHCNHNQQGSNHDT